LPSGALAASSYASWGQRVGATLLDAVPGFALVIVGYTLAFIVGNISGILGGLMFLATWLLSAAVAFYVAYLDGEGQSPGKAIMGIRVIGEATQQPIGGGMGIARRFLHIVDYLPCFIGFLFPLWDPKRQTFADKILTTVVVPGPKEEFAAAYKRLIPKLK
jgi:uncharacterized RDD family membrane protein YckC